MHTYSRDPAVNRSLRLSLKDAGAFAIMTGMGETYLSAFALFLNATTQQIGLLASLPPLVASLFQLVSAWLGRLTGHRKYFILAGASLQASAWLPLLLLPLLFPAAAVPLLIACVVIYHVGAHLAAPQWSSLMGDLVPSRKRGRFFAQRTRLMTALTFTALVSGGLILDFSARAGSTVSGFVTLFLVAACARYVSVYFLAHMHDPPGHVSAMEFPFTRSWLNWLLHANSVRFSVFFALLQFAVAISSPFFTVYMLRDLQFTYLLFTANTGTAILVQFLTLSQWGRISDVFGNRRILAATGILIPLLPLLWIFSTNFWYLILVQAVSGFAWAGFSLSAGNFIYDLVEPSRRTTYMAVHNVIAGVGVFCGAMLGGYLGEVLPVQAELFGNTYTWISPLCGVFVISALTRAVVVALLIPKLREVRPVRPITFTQLIFRVTRVNALAGVVFDIIGSRGRSEDKD